MSHDTNSLFLTGRLVGDPQASEHNAKVTTFSVASEENWTEGATGERRSYTNFFDCEIWGTAAEHLRKICAQGDLVLLEARLHQSRWTNADAQNLSRVHLNVQSWKLLRKKKAQPADSTTEEAS